MPAQAFASVKIVDVMYDPSGADQGREWIQIANTGNEPISLIGYRLYEGGINHKLSVSVGTSTLAGGAEAIITTDPGQYTTDHSAFAGTIFKSSFSLSNTGETIELKDASLKVVDTYSYVAPPVVKAPVPAKVTKTKKSPAIAAKPASYSYTAGATQAAALPMATLPQIPALPRMWLYGLGLVTLFLLGAAVVLYAWPNLTATSSPEEEFELE